jgi:putative phage-type endonuclease
MKIHNIEQGTPEWHEVRKLKMTASNATAIGNCGAGLKTYIKEIILNAIAEKEHYSNSDIERGHELEPIARSMYEFEKGVEIKEVGFIEFNEYVGYSPDGLVNEDGLVEIKARNNSKHLDIILSNEAESSVIWQMNMGMYVSGRDWCDFISFNPNFKKSLFVKRYYRDSEKIEAIKKGLELGEKMIKEYLENPIIKSEIDKNSFNN